MKSRLLVAALIPSLAILLTAAAPPSTDFDADWRAALSDTDRSCLERGLGEEPPDISGLPWIGGSAQSWKRLRGRVVVVQSWSNNDRPSFRTLKATVEAITGAGQGKATVIGLHTPEGADDALIFSARNSFPCAVAIDKRGDICDRLGVYKEPVNLVIDRQGMVRYVGLSLAGLRSAVKQLIEEPYEAPDVAVEPEPEPEEDPTAKCFPEPKSSVGSARNMQGRRAPRLHVQTWLTPEPSVGDKVLVVDFWATWCGPCRKSIPHTNELAEQFREDVVFVGISNEGRDKFDAGMKKHRLRLNEFKYSLALDSRAKMKSWFRVRGIPHAAVMSSDGVVRWQGHPALLRASTIEQIVKGNHALLAQERSEASADAEPEPVDPVDACARWASNRR